MGIASPDLMTQPAYRAAEAAHILMLPAGTVKAWSFGHDYQRRVDGKRKRFKRVIEPASARQHLLSFENLCELHLLAVIRRRHRVQLPQIRSAVEYMRNELGVERPLAAVQFRTNGVDLFVECTGRLLNVSKQGQQALREDFEHALARVEFSRSGGGPVRLFPYTRPPVSGEEQPRTVIIDPTRSFGRPVVDRAFVRTEIIEERFKAGDSIAEIAGDYGLKQEVVEEALRFEQRRAA